MPLNIVNNDYHVDTFLDMQKDLEKYLKEGYDIDGEWTIAEKKRFINRGCAAIAAATLSTKTVITQEIVGSPTNPIRELPMPGRIIQPVRLFINGYEYLENTFDQWLAEMGGVMPVPAGTVSSTTGPTSTIPTRFNRFFYWDEYKNALLINPPIEEEQTVQFYVIAMPNLLVNDTDVSMLNPLVTSLAAAWAAWRLLPQDEEYKGRGREAQRNYLNGLRDFRMLQRQRKGNIAKTINKNMGQFRRISADRPVDMGDNWDRIH